MNHPLVSIVLPAFNEEGNIVELYRRICAAARNSFDEFELLFIDDGSTDSSPGVIRALHESDPRVGLIRLSRNFGHQAAIMAGLDHARGDVVILMDADLQHPPELLPQLIARWRAGQQVIQMVRRTYGSMHWLKRSTSSLFYRLLRHIASAAILPGSADFFLLDRCVVDAINQCREHARFTRGLVSWVGFRREVIEYDCAERFRGRSKYSLGKMLRLAADGIFAFSVAPLRLAGVTGLAATLLGVIYLLYVVAVLLSGGAAPGWASLVAVVVFMGGVQLTILWIMGEYVSRIAKQTRGRPSYFIAEKVPADNRNDAQRQPTSGEASQPAALFLDRRLR